ncbi:hypothetical protein SAMN05421819_2317 [Bryocella elongata]|uniref:Uncharacterized protein n=1 Tax=Bryocella elongata TaxID=863522 RepID=A0A1H5YHH1_9BACT|nr:hypothetical protein [Bryocella elongata]SEG23498.1 hypothetical protein SAMN05421819_2317 [Bryocella elongata]
MNEPEQNPVPAQDAEFSGLMQEFRAACVQTAHREFAAAQVAKQERAAAAMRADVSLRWGAPALAALALMLAGGGWGAWWYTHAAHAQVPHGPHDVAHVANPANLSTDAAAVSDDVLLSEVQSDLSDRVPQALEPLAVSYTSNSYAHSGQKEIQ